MLRFNMRRMGNIIYNKIEPPISTYMRLRARKRGSTSAGGRNRGDHDRFADRPVAFDVRGSPFGSLGDNESYYSLG
jgi:hypothetical protein